VKKANLASLPKTRHFVKLNDMNFSDISVDSVELNDKRIYATYYRKKHEIISYLHHHDWLRLPEWERLEKLQRERILKHLANAKEEIISVGEHHQEKIKEIEANVNSPDRVSRVRRLKDDGIAQWDHYFKWNTYWWTVYQQLYT
jgi:3-dehydroquinate dehydratase